MDGPTASDIFRADKPGSDKGVSEEGCVRRREGAIDMPRYDGSGASLRTSRERRLWFMHHQDTSASTAYQSTIELHLRGELDRANLLGAVARLVEQHPELSAVLLGKASASAAMPVEQPEGDHWPINFIPSASESVLRIKHQETIAPFDLAKGPLFRIQVLEIRPRNHILLLSVHEIACERDSIHILAKEFLSIYAAIAKGQDTKGVAQRTRCTTESIPLVQNEGGEQREFWRRYLSGAPEYLQLPTDFVRVAGPTFPVDRVQFTLPVSISNPILDMADSRSIPLCITLLAGWAIALGRWSGQEEIVIGVRLIHRGDNGFGAMDTPSDNLVALRVCLRQSSTLADLIEQLKEDLAQVSKHQDVALEALIEAMSSARTLKHRPIVQVRFTLAEDINDVAVYLNSLNVELGEPVSARSESDLSLRVFRKGDRIDGTLEYATDIFRRGSIERMVGHLQRVLGQLASKKPAAIDSISLLTTTERRQILKDFNDTRKAYPCPSLVHELFEQQVATRPNSVAVVCGQDCLTYHELNRRANRIAHALVGLGVRPDDCVGIFVDRGLEMVIGLLAILKAGGAYVPFDPEYPVDRIEYMLGDCTPVAVLTLRGLRDRLAKCNAILPLLELDVQTCVEERQYHDDNLSIVGLTATHLAYVIYTSGSTGRPKGVLNQHDAAFYRICWALQHFRLTHQDVVLQKTSLGCDFSVWEIFLPLSGGGRLVVARPGGHYDPSYLIEEVEAREVTALFFVPSMLQMFVNQAKPYCCPSVRQVLSSGEALSRRLQSEFLEKLAHCELYNLYGPTEGTIDVTCCRCATATEFASMGWPIENATIYVLERQGHLVPIGIVGEMYIGGPGVARGYLNRPALTAERFVPDPFSEEAGARLYRTGDLARWLPDGSLEYLGRNDLQVKIRGFRVELGEIETQLAACDEVGQAVVIARQESQEDRRLVAYIVPKSGARISRSRLRSVLSARLPSYMVPNAFVVVNCFPLNANGKLDRNALPPDDASAVVHHEYEPPGNEVESELAALWQATLGLERVGRYDHFFELGGHSVMGMKMLAVLTARFGIRFPPLAIFQYPTLQAIAGLIQRLLSQSSNPGPA